MARIVLVFVSLSSEGSLSSLSLLPCSPRRTVDGLFLFCCSTSQHGCKFIEKHLKSSLPERMSTNRRSMSFNSEAGTRVPVEGGSGDLPVWQTSHIPTVSFVWLAHRRRDGTRQ